MDKSILDTIKRLLGISEEDDSFDVDVIVFINSALFSLSDIGIGYSEGFRITGKEETWKSYLGDDYKILGAVQDYIYFKVKLKFDPPTSSSVAQSYENQLKETEWRLCNRDGDSIV